MAAVSAPTDSILAVDFGSVNTRVALLDVVDGEFRFVAGGAAPTTVEPPFSDVGEGLRHALDSLQSISGRPYLDEEERLILPSRPDGAGVDAFAATASAGQPLRTVIVGLMPDVSVESARRAAASSYLAIVDTFSLSDSRRDEEQVDMLLRLRPDLVIITGGTDGGARAAVLRLADTVAMALSLMSRDERPRVLFAGNVRLRERVQRLFEDVATVQVAGNVRPALQTEAILSAERNLAQLYDSIRATRIAGYGELADWSGGNVMPTARAFGNLVRFTSHIFDPAKGVLGVDVGSAATTVAAAFGGDLALTVRPDVGVGHSAGNLLRYTSAERIARWLPTEIPLDEITDFVNNKSLAPGSIPQELDELYLEHAMAREALAITVASSRANWPARIRASRSSLLPAFDPILGSGAVLAHAPKPAQAALTLLDGLQPTGITTLLIDQHNLAPSLGAAAAFNAVASVQVFQSGAFANLGATVCPVGKARPGQHVLRVRMKYSNGERLEVEVRYGTIEVLPLPLGQEAQVSLQPLKGFDIGYGRGQGRRVLLTGGTIGLIVDARGRPVAMERDPAQRREQLQRWLAELGA
ncbi:MAG: glutamate mutase L [Anaerolineales bacterium]